MNIQRFYQDYKLALWLTPLLWISAYFIGGWIAVYQVIVLSLMEISLSIDNAVVNAKELQTMDEVWRRRFIVWGIPIAVFVMRGFFPIEIVSLVGNVSFLEAADMTLSDPVRYAAIITGAVHLIAGFGAAFLGLVALGFFVDAEKDVHWIPVIEQLLAKVGAVNFFNLVHLVLVGGALYALSLYVEPVKQAAFLWSGALGALVFIAIGALKGALQKDEDGRMPWAFRWMSLGMAQFMYLEILDASFSFDGVIGAFALTNHSLIIMIGLAIGAIWVREVTLALVRNGTLAEFRYLEHGAFWAIAILAIILGISPFMHLPEIVSGTIGLVLLALAVITSVMWKRRNPEPVEAEVKA